MLSTGQAFDFFASQINVGKLTSSQIISISWAIVNIYFWIEQKKNEQMHKNLS
jgi:hypothetical protein